MLKWIRTVFGKRSGATPAPSSPSSVSVSTPRSVRVERKNYDERHLYTPNKGSKVITPEAVILHHSSGSYQGTVSWIENPVSKVSYHVVIARDGRRTVFGEDTDRMWHAGKSSWMGRPDLNSWSLGVAWEGDTYSQPLGDDAIDSALEYIVPRMKKWRIPLSRVLTHGEVAPGRKNDVSPEAAEKFEARLKDALKD